VLSTYISIVLNDLQRTYVTDSDLTKFTRQLCKNKATVTCFKIEKKRKFEATEHDNMTILQAWFDKTFSWAVLEMHIITYDSWSQGYKTETRNQSKISSIWLSEMATSFITFSPAPALGWAQFGIYTCKRYTFRVIPNDSVHMKTKTLLCYFQINTIPWTSALCPQGKKWENVVQTWK
jgi:hypothetical protein